MANIVIDPVIVMIPSDDAGRTEVEAWFVRGELRSTRA